MHSERVRNTRVIKSIVYGNHASLLPHKNDKGHTHHWKVYVRAYDTQENLSHYIRKVQFRLHESYQNSVRMVEKVPFELNETGWGEFDIQIKLYFVDVNEKPVTFFHYLRLHQPLIELTTGIKIVMKDHYDEIIFNEPTELMYRALMKHPNPKADKNFETQRLVLRNKLDSENRQIIAEIDDLKRTLKDGWELVQKYRRELQDGTGGATTSSGADQQQQQRER